MNTIDKVQLAINAYKRAYRAATNKEPSVCYNDDWGWVIINGDKYHNADFIKIVRNLTRKHKISC